MNKSLLKTSLRAIIFLMILSIFGWAHPPETNTASLGQVSASGIKAAEDDSVPAFSHVIIIIFENKEFDQVIGNSRMPRFNGLSKQYTLLTRYYAITHPSLPNYIALISGDTFGIDSDCTDCFVNARCLPDLLEANGRSWKTYQEGLPRAGFKGNSSGRYAIKHNPFLYFEAVRNDNTRCRRSVVPLTQLDIDLKEDQLPGFAFIVPDLCHSSHDCDVKVTDTWLGRIVDSILNSSAFDQNSLLVLTFDEGATNEGCCGPSPLAQGGRIATVLISPLVQKGFADSTAYSHYSLLKTISAAWKLEELGHSSASETNLIVLPWQHKKP
jgi:phospholipase C